MIRTIVHMGLHVIAPGVLAGTAFADRWLRAWGIMLLTMVVDLDHLLSDPVFDPERCSIGHHPLHSYPAIAVYVLLTLPPKTRLIGLGLVIHMLLDGIDCIWMHYQ